MDKWLLVLIRFMMVAIVSITVCDLQDAWNATLVDVDSYLISLWLVLALAILTFVLTFLPDYEAIEEKSEWSIKGQKTFMDKVENFEIEGEIKDEN